MVHPAGRRARSRAVAGLGTAVLAMFLLLVPMATVTATVKSWSADANPSVVHLPSTKVLVTATNLGIDSSSTAIGCVKISIPADVGVIGADIALEPVGKSWVVATSGGNPAVVTAHAVTNADWLTGGTVQESIGIAVTAAPSSNGSTTWTATAFRTKNCTLASTEVIAMSLDVIGAAATPTPTPKPTPTPTPKPTATPVPTANPTPSPATATPTPLPAATPVPPGATSAPPGATATATQPATGPLSSTSTASPDGSAIPGTSPDPTIDTSAGGSPGPTSSPDPGALGGVTSGGDSGGPSDAFTIGGTSIDEIGDLSGELSASVLGVEWAVPAIIMAVPGLLLIIVILIQAMGASVWLPIVRRSLGTFGIDVHRARA